VVNRRAWFLITRLNVTKDSNFEETAQVTYGAKNGIDLFFEKYRWRCTSPIFNAMNPQGESLCVVLIAEYNKTRSITRAKLDGIIKKRLTDPKASPCLIIFHRINEYGQAPAKCSEKGEL